MMPQAIIRDHIEKIAGVSRTWFEWTWEDAKWAKTLVVEVEFDTDPSAYEFRRSVLDEIEGTLGLLQDKTAMVVSCVKVVPRHS
jgi:hypothetical protein